MIGVPLLGDPVTLALTIGLLLLASLGIGLLIAVVSDSERQAVQLSLLLLLASVFFSGFVLAITEFSEPVRAAAYLLPVTSAIGLLQDIMLRGTTGPVWRFAVLGGIAAVTLFLRLARAATGHVRCLSVAAGRVEPSRRPATASAGRARPRPRGPCSAMKAAPSG